MAFCVEEGIEALFERIRRAGGSVFELEDSPLAARQLFTLDPWGNMLEFCTYAASPGASPLRIVVSGGSIGGVTAALWLRDGGHDVEVSERSPRRLDGRGAGIVLHQATLHYLIERCGVPVESISEGARALHYLADDGEVVFAKPTDLRVTSWNTLHRRLLHDFGDDRFRVGEPVLGFRCDAGGVEVEVQGCGCLQCDLLVCAEGSSSSSRRLLLPEVGPVYSGYVGWRGTVDPLALSPATQSALKDLIVYAVLPHNQVLCYPIPGAVEDAGTVRLGFNLVWCATWLPAPSWTR